MTTKTSDATLVTIVMLVGLAMIFDLHRTILQAAWPVISSYLDWLFS